MTELQLRLLRRADIPTIVQAFSSIGWDKPAKIYEEYDSQQNKGEREILTVWSQENFAGYVTLKWESDYPPFKEQKIPEIKDLNVLPCFRNRGIGSLLLDEIEKVAFAKSPVVGLGVGLTADYQDAFRLYNRRRFELDGRGLYHPKLKGGHARYGDEVVVDDDCTLWLIKTRDGSLGDHQSVCPKRVNFSI